MKEIKKHITGYSIIDNSYKIDIKAFNEEQNKNRIVKVTPFDKDEYREKAIELFIEFEKYIKKNKILEMRINFDIEKEYHNDMLLEMQIGELKGDGIYCFYTVPTEKVKVDEKPHPFTWKIEDIDLTYGGKLITDIFYKPYTYKNIEIANKRVLFELKKSYDVSELFDFFQLNFFNGENPNIRECYHDLKKVFSTFHPKL